MGQTGFMELSPEHLAARGPWITGGPDPVRVETGGAVSRTGPPNAARRNPHPFLIHPLNLFRATMPDIAQG